MTETIQQAFYRFFTRKLSEKKQIELIVQNAFEVGVIAVVVVDSAKYCVPGVVHCISCIM